VTGEPPNQANVNRYVPIYERFVDKAENPVLGLVAYGLYKKAKREWSKNFVEQNGRQPTDPERLSYMSSLTDATVHAYNARATEVLASYAESVVNDATPRIREDALRGTFVKNVGVNISANIIYTILLIAFALILKFNGVDLLSISDKQ
jgi:hypothetical protein